MKNKFKGQCNHNIDGSRILSRNYLIIIIIICAIYYYTIFIIFNYFN